MNKEVIKKGIEKLKPDYYGGRLSHIILGDTDYSLCGYGTDEPEPEFLKDEKEWFVPIKQYTSNCSECIKMLKHLRAIKK